MLPTVLKLGTLILQCQKNNLEQMEIHVFYNREKELLYPAWMQ